MSLEDKTFLGRGWSFPPTFTPRGRSITMVSAEEDIKQSLEVLFSTAQGERVLNPSFGSDLNALLFEPSDVSFMEYIKDRLKSSILLYEPRITVDGIEMVTAVLEGRIDIEITFTINTTNTRHNMVFPFYLNEGTNIK